MLTKRAALAAASEAFGVPAWGERYRGSARRCFGVEHHIAAQFVIGRTMYNGGREVLGRGLSWDEALANAKERANGRQFTATRSV